MFKDTGKHMDFSLTPTFSALGISVFVSNSMASLVFPSFTHPLLQTVFALIYRIFLTCYCWIKKKKKNVYLGILGVRKPAFMVSANILILSTSF